MGQRNGISLKWFTLVLTTVFFLVSEGSEQLLDCSSRMSLPGSVAAVGNRAGGDSQQLIIVLLTQILVWLIPKKKFKKQIICMNLNLILSLLLEVISVGWF